MGLKEVHSKMKLVEVDEAAAPPAATPRPAPAAPPPVAAPARRPTLDEVLKAAPPRPKIEEAALPPAAAAGDEIPDFTAIYQAAGVKDPAHGFSSYKVLEIFSSPEFAPLDLKAKAAALTGFLKMNPTGPVPIAHVIQDAVVRDQALDGFEDFLQKKLEARKDELDRENAKLQGEIDEITRRNQEKMDANARALEGEVAKLATWQTRKRIEERKLFDAVAPFVEDNPVSVGSKPEGA
jgi:Skp family chaperone for outer membrane proteins